MTEQAEVKSRGLLRIAIALLLIGAALLWLASGLTWVIATPPGAGSSESIDGGSALPALRAVALLSLAAVGGLLAASATLKRVVGGVVAFAGVASLVALVVLLNSGFASALATVPSGLGGVAEVVGVNVAGPAVAALGLLIVTAGGVVALVRPGDGAGLGRRFDRPSADRPGNSSADLWSALDRGEDPTEDPAR